jgi:hypothetical protein
LRGDGERLFPKARYALAHAPLRPSAGERWGDKIKRGREREREREKKKKRKEKEENKEREKKGSPLPLPLLTQVG